ncbi:cobyric acid synthase [Amycolatopsis anabasis]|uniref:cobyric acid synthase n=1 Tax=Amycolatopsis anabasis TaxID=1840409 RepID=UPI001C551B4B|nr:cobyric acid synthase [Amycolatopsis anabasis]
MVLRSPRLAVAGFDPEVVGAVVGGLAGYLARWDIQVHVYAATAEAADRLRGGDPGRGIAGALADLAGQPWRAVTNWAAAANGGDLTVLALTASPDLGGLSADELDVVRATETPVVLAVSPAERAAVDPGTFEFVGFLVADHGSLAFEPVDTAPVPTDELAGDGLGPEAVTRAGALLVLAHRAPDLEPVAEAAENPDPGVERLRPLHPGGTRPAGRTLMISGTHSSAGKTFLVTAFARYFADRGLTVAPFKGQNMSNNARVVDGGEIGVAQYIQALAARQVPDVRMNPVLIKPQDRRSHVLVLGRYDAALSALPWRLRKPPSWPAVSRALRDLRDEYDLVVMEGAGSPAEPGQYHNDIVNMRVAREVGAPVLLATDGARGGGIAHCYGTWQILPAEDRALLQGFIINRFFAKGNPVMLRPGRNQLERLTALPTLGVIPEVPYTLPEEDSYSLVHRTSGTGLKVAVVAYPSMSNFDEFTPLTTSGAAEVTWARQPADLSDVDLLILPGAKDVPASARWLDETGLDRAIRAYARSGKRLLAICGGLQLVGETFTDAAEVEGTGQGLGVLALNTVYEADKIQRHGRFTFGRLDGPWQGLSEYTVDGYEIRHGRTDSISEREIVEGGVGFVRHNVLAVYFHGLFENANALEAILGVRLDPRQELEHTFDALADTLATHLDMAAIERIVFG